MSAVTDAAASFAGVMARSAIWALVSVPVTLVAAIAASWLSVSCPVIFAAARSAIWAEVIVPVISLAAVTETHAAPARR